MKYAALIRLNWQSAIVESEAEREAFCQMLNEVDGVHQHSNGLWWFYDETGADEFGGFVTKEEALESAKCYGEWLSGGMEVKCD